jgi:hypothetical protein
VPLSLSLLSRATLIFARPGGRLARPSIAYSHLQLYTSVCMDAAAGIGGGEMQHHAVARWWSRTVVGRGCGSHGQGRGRGHGTGEGHGTGRRRSTLARSPLEQHRGCDGPAGRSRPAARRGGLGWNLVYVPLQSIPTHKA